VGAAHSFGLEIKKTLMSLNELTMVFFFQLAVILAAVRLVGLAARKIGQPQVVGEMIAGVLLGPSLFGLLSPDWQTRVFPEETQAILYIVSQIGLVLYMFLIGAEFDVSLIRKRLRAATMVSLAGILVPFTLGGLLALWMQANGELFAPTVKPWEAMLFTGSAMAITAFPMLARIIYERGLAGTSLGTLALAAGSIDDAAAWSLLAIVLASFGGEAWIALSAIGGGVIYAGFALVVARPMLRHLDVLAERNQGFSGAMFAFILMLLMLGAWFTDMVGIYAVFGAFLLGIALPRGRVTQELERRIEPLTTNFLLPLFFVYSGLNTQLGLIIDPALLGITVLVVLIAVLGKGVACWAAARLSGESPQDSIAIGSLMNARGLMELILLNIGLQRGVITPTLFTIMVLMAVLTTLMASPVFEFAYRKMLAPVPAEGSAL
jgi:Kef-type K+ transport system membrane component KefB